MRQPSEHYGSNWEGDYEQCERCGVRRPKSVLADGYCADGLEHCVSLFLESVLHEE
jgi:hypothetical protein